jgi:hypothetical protein
MRRAYALKGRQREGSARGLASVIGSPTPSIFTARSTTPAPRRGPVIRYPSASQGNHLVDASPYGRTGSMSISNQDHIPGTSRINVSSRNMAPPSFIPTHSIKKGQLPATSIPSNTSRSYSIPNATPLRRRTQPVPEPSSATRRMWNWMGSFLRSGSTEPTPEEYESREWIPALPPITDADREALRHVSPQPPKPKERIIPPKEQVQLQHVPTPVPIRNPPKLSHKSSTGSVKDLIRSYESLSEMENNDPKSGSQKRNFVIKKRSDASLSAASFDSSRDISRRWSQDRSRPMSTSLDNSRSFDQSRNASTSFNAQETRVRWSYTSK